MAIGGRLIIYPTSTNDLKDTNNLLGRHRCLLAQFIQVFRNQKSTSKNVSSISNMIDKHCQIGSTHDQICLIKHNHVCSNIKQHQIGNALNQICLIKHISKYLTMSLAPKAPYLQHKVLCKVNYAKQFILKFVLFLSTK